VDKSSGDEDAGVDAQEGAGWREVGSVCAEREDLATVARVLEDVEGAGACGRGDGGNGRVRIPREVCGGDGNPRDKT